MISFYRKHRRQRPFFLYCATGLSAHPGDQQPFSSSFQYPVHNHSSAVGSYEDLVWVYMRTLWREEQPLPITLRDGEDLSRMPVAQPRREMKWLPREPDVQDQKSIIPAAEAIVRALELPFVSVCLGLSVCLTLEFIHHSICLPIILIYPGVHPSS